VSERILVIGNGMIGHRFCDRLTAEDAGRRFRVTVFGDEPRPAYDRVHLSRALERGADTRKTLDSLELEGRSWYRSREIEIHLDDPVVRLDREHRVAFSARGIETGYDRVVFATGARPAVPPIPGVDGARVHLYRTADDAARIAGAVECSRAAAVVGGGLLGLEVAQVLRERGLEVTVVEAAPSLLVRQLNVVAGAFLKQLVESFGVRVLVGATIDAIEDGDGNGETRIRLANKRIIDVDVVVLAVGIRPRDDVARNAGLECGVRGGIKVDERLTTSDERIHAVGECALIDGEFFGLVAPGYRMVEVLVRNLLGGRDSFRERATTTRLKFRGIEVNTVGDPAAPGRSLVHSSSDSYRQVVVIDSRIAGVTSVGKWNQLGRAKEAHHSRRKISDREIERFRTTGDLWLISKTDDTSSWPGGTIICECASISLGELRNATSAGCDTIALLASRTGASTFCGSCRPILARLTGESEASASGGRWLAGAACVALGGFLVTLVAPAVPFAASVASAGWLDHLWRNGVVQQTSGFTLLGLCLASLILSVRKRWSRFRRGSYGTWRSVHVVVGALTLLGFFFHTGLRLGANFNFLLSAIFLLLVLLGACSGIAHAANGRSARLARLRIPTLVTNAHVLFFWPLVVFVAFHILAVYYF